MDDDSKANRRPYSYRGDIAKVLETGLFGGQTRLKRHNRLFMHTIKRQFFLTL